MATTIENETTPELHPDAIICPSCGHDCDLIDCGDTCICVEEYEEYEEDDEWLSEQQAAYDDYWGDPLDSFPSYGD